MKKFLRIPALLLTVIMAVGILAACGSGKEEAAEPDPNAGVYRLASIMGMSIEDAQELTGEDYSDYLTVELMDGGKGKMTIEGEEYNIDWELEGDAITIKADGDSVTGTLENGKITAEFEGVEVTFVKE